MSRSIARGMSHFVEVATCWMRPYRRTNTRSLVSEYLSQLISVDTEAGPLSFYGPSARSLHDPYQLHTGEPETISWIDGLPSNEVLWDVGANVGTYALYAAKVRRMRVLAFEPSAATYAVLVRNVEINKMDDLLDAYCLAFDESTHLNHLFMAHTEAGHSMHAFGQKETVEGKLDVVFRQAVPGFAIDDFIEIFRPPPPDHIKLDVDSIEEKVLRGADKILKNYVKSVLVEIDGTTRSEGGTGIRRVLTDSGFVEQEGFCENARRNVLFRRSSN